ncbi:MAG: hypothetical protein AB8B68_05545 [Rickettsiaceae bacterium]
MSINPNYSTEQKKSKFQTTIWKIISLVLALLVIFISVNKIFTNNIDCKNTDEYRKINNFSSTYTEAYGLDKKDYPFISRPEFINLIDTNQKILEIGPFIYPSLKGKNVKYFDVQNRDGLIARAKIDKGHDLDNIDTLPDIDFVHLHGDLKSVPEKFDIIYSSHLIEHTVDLIQHLNDVEALLNSEGKYYLFIPDKRFCFDHFIPDSRLSGVIATHEARPIIHSLENTLISHCESGHSWPDRHWNRDHEVVTGATDLSCYKRVLQLFKDADGTYIDMHKWRFSPESFELIINQLIELGFIHLEIEKIYGTPPQSNEFQVVLRKIKG